MGEMVEFNSSLAIFNFSYHMNYFFKGLSRLGLFFCVWMTVGAGFLTAQDFQGKKITRVVVEYVGAKTVNEAKLRNFMKVRPGQTFDYELIDGDIRRLFDSGLVDDVQMLADDDAGGIKIIAKVKTKAGFAGVGFEGNSVFSDNKLRKDSEVKGGGTISDAEILEAGRKIKELYRSYGYPDVGVSHRLQATEREGYEDLIFSIQEGAKSEVRKIFFEGASEITPPELKRVLNTKQKGFFSFLTKSGKINGDMLEADVKKLTQHYRNKGFYKAKVSYPNRVQVKDGRADLIFPVYEGPRYQVNGVGFGKTTVFTPKELLPALSLIAGDVYSARKVEDDKTLLRSYYGSRGYADASVKADIRDMGNNSVNIVYRINEGSRYKVGRVNIQGNTKSKDNVIRREVPLRPGQNFNSVNVETTRNRLQNLDYFDQVDVTTARSLQTGYRDVNILVNEKKTGSVSFGAGFSSVDNIVGFVNLEQSNFDLLNWGRFTGGGQRFSADLRLGAERQDVTISLVEPWFLGRRLAFGGDLFYRSATFFSDQYDQAEFGGALFIRKPLGKRSYLRAEYRLERIDIDVDNGASAAFQAEDDKYVRSKLGLQYVYDSRDSNIMPREGHRLNAGLDLGLGGDVTTYDVSVSGAKHWQLKWDMIFNLSGEFSTVDGFSGDDRVPIFERKFLGGARNLRGFEFRDIGRNSDAGSRDAASGEPLGGQSSAYVTAEVTFPIYQQIRGAVFTDWGVVNEDSWDFDVSNLYGDAGVGLRLNLPFGPLAIDYGIPLVNPDDDDDVDNGGQFNFYLNYQF